MTPEEAYLEIRNTGKLIPGEAVQRIRIRELFDLGVAAEGIPANSTVSIAGVDFDKGFAVSGDQIDFALTVQDSKISHLQTTKGLVWGKSVEFIDVRSRGAWFAKENRVKGSLKIDNSDIIGVLDLTGLVVMGDPIIRETGLRNAGLSAMEGVGKSRL